MSFLKINVEDRTCVSIRNSAILSTMNGSRQHFMVNAYFQIHWNGLGSDPLRRLRLITINHRDSYWLVNTEVETYGTSQKIRANMDIYSSELYKLYAAIINAAVQTHSRRAITGPVCRALFLHSVIASDLGSISLPSYVSDDVTPRKHCPRQNIFGRSCFLMNL